MKFLNNLTALMGVTGIVFVLVGCGISKDEHEKISSELYKTKVEIDKTKAELTKTKKEFANTETELSKIRAALDKTRAELGKTKIELDKTKMELKRTNAELVGMEKALNKTQSLLKIDLEKQAIKSQLIAARHEAVYLKEEFGELLNRFLKTTEELNMAQKANEILRTQMNELINEKDRL